MLHVFYLDVVCVCKSFQVFSGVFVSVFRSMLQVCVLNISIVFRHMLQVFYLNVAYVAVAIFICCKHIFQMFHLF
jgi:hypothetical protein